MGPTITERVVAEVVEDRYHGATTLSPWLGAGGRRVGSTGIGVERLVVVIDIGVGTQSVWRGRGARLRVPVSDELLLEGPRAEVLDVSPVPQVGIADQHGVETVRGRTDHVQGSTPPLNVTLGQRQSPLASQLIDLVRVQAVQPGLRAADDQGGRGRERGVQLHLDAVSLVDLCRRRHRSTYAEHATMPTLMDIGRGLPCCGSDFSRTSGPLCRHSCGLGWVLVGS